MPESQVAALLSLLSDESPAVREHCERAARGMGRAILKPLREQAVQSEAPELREASTTLLGTIVLDQNLEALHKALPAVSLNMLFPLPKPKRCCRCSASHR